MESLTRVKRLEFDRGQKITCVYMRNEDSVTSLKILCFTLSHTSACTQETKRSFASTRVEVFIWRTTLHLTHLGGLTHLRQVGRF